MIDPQNITNFHRSDKELQEFLLFSVCVAGKNAKIQAQKVSDFIDAVFWDYQLSAAIPKLAKTVFDMLKSYTEFEIEGFLRKVKMGQYKRIATAIHSVANLINPRTCSLEQLGQVKGIGPKTARFFLLHSRPNARIAVLDTHILKFLSANQIANVPKSTPQNPKEYSRLENEFLQIYDKFHVGLTVAEFDLEVWKSYSK